MIEFLVKRTDGEWFDLHYDRRAEILRPLTIPSQPVEGWGSHRILVEGVEVSFSVEDPGIQIAFETDGFSSARAREIVDDICKNIEITLGQKTRLVEI